MIQPVAAVGCVRCLCEVCTRLQCPRMHNHRYRLNYCLTMMQQGRCPPGVIKCDYFEHRQKRRLLLVVRRFRKVDILTQRLITIEQKLDALIRSSEMNRGLKNWQEFRGNDFQKNTDHFAK